MAWTEILSTTIWTVLICGGVGAVLFFVLYLRKFNIQVILREHANGRTLVKVDKARIFIDNSNNRKLQLLKDRGVIPDVPQDVIDITSNGAKFLEIVKTADQQYVFAKFNADGLLNDLKDKDKHFHLVSAGSRIATANQMLRGLEMKKNGLGQLLQTLAPIILIAIVGIVGYLMYESIGEKMASAMDSQAAVTAKQVELQSEMKQTAMVIRDIIQNRQTIMSLNLSEAPN